MSKKLEAALERCINNHGGVFSGKELTWERHMRSHR